MAEPVLRLEAWQEAGRAAGLPPTRDAKLAAGLREEQKRERVRADISAIDLAELLMDAIEGGLISGLRRSSEPAAAGTDTRAGAAELSRAIQARVDLVLDGFRKRNERVAAPSGRLPT